MSLSHAHSPIQNFITEPLINQAESLITESVIQTQLSPHKLSGYRLTASFIDADTQDIICYKMQIP